MSTGYPELNEQLPGGGWPSGLIELLSDQPGLREAALLAPCWSAGSATGGSNTPTPWIAWVVPDRLPWVPHAPGWEHLGIDTTRVLWVRVSQAADAAWAIEQMMRERAVHSVVWVAPAWVRSVPLRRTHWAAKAAGIPLFVARPMACQADASPALLRLRLHPTVEAPGAAASAPEGTLPGTTLARPGLRIEFLKRQGLYPQAPLRVRPAGGVHLLPLSAGSRRVGVPLNSAPNFKPQHAVDRPAPAEVAA